MRLSGKRRIAVNVVATYGRSLYALVIGLFCGRWALMALGEVDYGLMGLVGGLMAFVAFLNGIMAESVSRYYAFAVGKANVAADRLAGVEECRRWFSIALPCCKDRLFRFRQRPDMEHVLRGVLSAHVS